MSIASGNARPVDVIVAGPDDGAAARGDAQAPAVLKADAPAPPPVIGAPAPPPVAAGGPTLKQRAVRSSMWTMGAFGFGQVIKVVSNPILAALLMPEHFGTVALISVFVTGMAALSDVGIEQAIIQNKRGDDPVFLNTAWTLHAIHGIALWLGCCLIAYPVSLLFHDKSNAHDLLVMLPVAGLGPLITGFNPTRIFTLNRHLNMGLLTILNLVYQLIGVAVMIGIAYVWPTPWAMVIGGLVSNVFWLIATHTLLPGMRNRFCWDPGVRRELMTFGKWIMVSTLITYTALQIDRPLLGKLMDEWWLGLYFVALSLVRMPAEIIGRLSSVTLFPALARAAEGRPQDMPRVLWRARGLILAVSMALTLGVVLCAPLFITIFYKPTWHLAGMLAQWASIGAWFMLLQVSADRALLALGRTRVMAASNAVNLIVTVAGGFVGRWVDLHFNHRVGDTGVIGFIIGMSAGKVAGHFMIQLEMAKAGISIFRQDVLYTGLTAGLCVAGVVGPRLLPGFTGRETIYNAATAVALCGVACGWSGLRILRGIR
jgi:O-antigen/teichoic acid export membrane protein